MEKILLWTAFHVLIGLLLFLDLGFFHRKPSSITPKQGTLWSSFWVICALAFNIGVYFFKGPPEALQFFTAYLIEKSLSIDNIFVFVLLFSALHVPKDQQYKILYWGILGAFAMRLLFILTGVTLLEKFHWLFYVFGAFLVLSGLEFALKKEEEAEKSLGVRLFHFLSKKYHFSSFFLAMLSIEVTDLLFAVDSIPAVFAITLDPFLAYTSNVFAILGLRSLYFAVAGLVEKLRFFKMGLGGILVFIGLKMLIQPFYELSVPITLVAISAILGISFLCEKCISD